MGTLDEISNEIRILFAGSENDAVYRLESVGNEFPAFVVRFMGSYGVAIPYQGSEIAEEFANATLVSNELKIDGHNEQYLLLISSKKISRNEFAVFCALFVNPGKDGALRRDITENPVSWWQKWKQLIGNSITEKRPYAVLGELIIFMHLLNLGRSVNWEGANSNSHDLISPNEEFEVKSTTSRYEKVIHVTGQFQLQSNKKLLFLYFCRFEKNQNGFSIDDIVDRLSRDCGVSKDELNTKLFRNWISYWK